MGNVDKARTMLKGALEKDKVNDVFFLFVFVLLLFCFFHVCYDSRTSLQQPPWGTEFTGCVER